MTTKDKVLDTLKRMGFQLEPLGNENYGFRYEMANMLYTASPDDEDFLTLAIPQIADIDDDNAMHMEIATGMINAAVKYVKAYRVDDSLWLFYERELFGEPDIEQILAHMILRLNAALDFARSMIAQHEND